MRNEYIQALSKTAMIFSLMLVQVASAQSFPRDFWGGWCQAGESDPSFFIDPKGASMGILQCKLRHVQSDPQRTRAGLVCTNFTGKYVDPWTVDISRGQMLLDQGGTVSKYRKCS